MRVSVLNQYAGQDTIAEKVGELLDDHPYDHFRVLMAFARGPGVGLIAKPLAAFLERGGRAEAIVGLDLGGTSPEALESLEGMGVELFVFGVKGDRTFHPKVYLLESTATGEYAAIVGSSNWSPGGLDSNFETCLLVHGVRQNVDDEALFAELDELWATYRGPASPMSEAHLKRVDAGLLAKLARELSSDESGAPDQRSSNAADDLFDSLEAPRAPLQRAPRSRSRDKTGDGSDTPEETGLPETLFLEVTGPETGAGREIQLPFDVLGDYFGVGLHDSYYMTFRHSDGTEEKDRPLAIYPANSTYRLSSGKFKTISDVDRPVIVRLDRLTEEAAFGVTIIPNGTREYADAEERLTRGGGIAKRWGVE